MDKPNLAWPSANLFVLRSLAYLADVARLEWAVNRALHAPDAQPLDASTLATVAPSDHERVCFVALPSVSMLRSSFPVDAIWGAVLQQDEAAMAAIDLGGEPVPRKASTGPRCSRSICSRGAASRSSPPGRPRHDRPVRPRCASCKRSRPVER
jgi:hypothetical protein